MNPSLYSTLPGLWLILFLSGRLLWKSGNFRAGCAWEGADTVCLFPECFPALRDGDTKSSSHLHPICSWIRAFTVASQGAICGKAWMSNMLM